jgi:enamine deaminase RidA (YjgF/YER057c/UK114 family)
METTTMVSYNVPARADGPADPDPFLARGVTVSGGVSVYSASGTGPSPTNSLAADGSPARFFDYGLLAALDPAFSPTEVDRAAGVLPSGMTATEAQGVNAMARVRENLASVGAGLEDLTFLRIYLVRPPGSERADYDGWNRAYRRFVANIDLVAGGVLPAYAPVIVENPTRPARSNIEVASLPRPGWLVEVEATAALRD